MGSGNLRAEGRRRGLRGEFAADGGPGVEENVVSGGRFFEGRRLVTPMNTPSVLVVCAALFLGAPLFSAKAESAREATSVEQYGITWSFDRARPTGSFVNGDRWVVGPVTVVAVSPAPGPAAAAAKTGEVKSRYGAVSMVDDARMRNGSMIVLKPGGSQGYDSRLKNYRPELSVAYPVRLEPGQSLISTISNETFPVPVMHRALMWSQESSASLALRAAAVLTVLTEPPPEDAFRPAYAGADKTIHRAKNLRLERLPRLAPPGQTPSWEQFERYLQRPWLDHISSWMLQTTGPSENQVNYGREFSRITSIASLMLMLDVPPERKETLMIGLVQLGIDLHGLARAGREWPADGGHWNGRKWPILFAGLMLGDRRFLTEPGRTVFSEDQQMYYGAGWHGRTALYQIVYHTGPKPPHEEKSPENWTEVDSRSEAYRMVVSGGLPGTALAVQLMGAKALWNHDAFFDYYDDWMNPEDPSAGRRGGRPRPKQEGKSLDPFVDAMWRAHRSAVPVQPGASANLKWVWGKEGGGAFVPNPAPPVPERK